MVISDIGYAILRDGKPVQVGQWSKRRAGIYPSLEKAKAALAQFRVRGTYLIVKLEPGKIEYVRQSGNE